MFWSAALVRVRGHCWPVRHLEQRETRGRAVPGRASLFNITASSYTYVRAWEYVGARPRVRARVRLCYNDSPPLFLLNLYIVIPLYIVHAQILRVGSLKI